MIGSEVDAQRSPAGVLVITLNRASKRNAITVAMARQLIGILADARFGVDRAIVIRSSDARFFSSGADKSMPPEDIAHASELLYQLYALIVGLPSPVIAAVEGYAIGGGAQLALAADLRVGNAQTEFRFMGLANRTVAGAWGLTALVGRARALEMILDKRSVGANEAMTLGMLNRLADDAAGAAIRWAHGLAELDPYVAAAAKAVTVESSGILAAMARERQENRGWPLRDNQVR